MAGRRFPKARGSETSRALQPRARLLHKESQTFQSALPELRRRAGREARGRGRGRPSRAGGGCSARGGGGRSHAPRRRGRTRPGPGGPRRRPAPTRTARYLQQVQLGHEAPRQAEEAVPSVREGHRHDRPARARSRRAIAAPHRPGPAPPSPPASRAGRGVRRSPGLALDRPLDRPRPLVAGPAGVTLPSLLRDARGRHTEDRVRAPRKRSSMASIARPIQARASHPALSLATEEEERVRRMLLWRWGSPLAAWRPVTGSRGAFSITTCRRPCVTRGPGTGRADALAPSR